MKRFYDNAGIEAVDGGWRVVLDGKPIRTQRGAPQVVPNEALAEALAAEWRDQGGTIDPRRFVLRDFADFAIDLIRPDRPAAIAKLLAFAETDTLCYRADPDEPLHRRQLEDWEPLVTDLEAREGIRLERVSGVLHRPQGEDTLSALQARLDSFDDFTLAALQSLASLTASLCIGLAALEDDAGFDRLWNAANLEELWQAEQWGQDPEADAHRDRKRDDFLAAARFARLSRG